MSEPKFYTVPKGTPTSICRGHKKPGGTCHAVIYWIEVPRMKKGVEVPRQTARIPVDCSVEGGTNPDSLSEGRGVSHFTQCPDAGYF